MKAALYARVSTRDQDPAMQLTDLRRLAEARGWTVEEEYVDHGYSGAKDRRPALDRLMAHARQRKLDVVCCWRFDRMARSVRHLVGLLDEFRALGVDFVSHQEAIDTSTPAGKVLFTVIAAFSEFERAILGERVRAGLAKARALGVRLGRPPKEVDPERVRQIYGTTKSVRRCADTLKLSRSLVYRILSGNGTRGAASDDGPNGTSHG